MLIAVVLKSTSYTFQRYKDTHSIQFLNSVSHHHAVSEVGDSLDISLLLTWEFDAWKTSSHRDRERGW